MGDERQEKIRRRAYEIWQREGGTNGDHDRQWRTAKEEIDREAETPLTLPEIGEIASSDVLTVEALAMRTGITGEQAQELLDRLGHDREAMLQAARELRTSKA